MEVIPHINLQYCARLYNHKTVIQLIIFFCVRVEFDTPNNGGVNIIYMFKTDTHQIRNSGQLQYTI